MNYELNTRHYFWLHWDLIIENRHYGNNTVEENSAWFALRINNGPMKGAVE